MLFIAVLYSFGVLASAFSRGSFQTPIALDHSQDYQFDELLHLPGTSPYFDAIGFGLDHKAPDGCNVTAASYLVRHGSIYCNNAEYDEYIKPFLDHLAQHQGGFSGPLEFLNTWKSPIIENKLEDLTPAGEVDAKKVGEHLLSRYPNLIPNTKRIIADKKSRTFDTARAFVRGWPHADDVEIVRIRKNVNGSLDVLNPHKTCPAFNKKPGTKEMQIFLSHYAPKVASRLSPYLPNGMHLTDKDILGLQSLCGYESAINGKRSKICAVFTDNEWMAYEYTWDMKYAYMVGPLNPLSPYLGFPWLQSQSELFSQLDSESGTGNGWPEGQTFFLSFTHREVPPFVATALGIFNSSSKNEHDEFPLTRVNWERAWKMSDLIPFLGHVGMEKISCHRPGAEGQYIRFIANTAPRPLPQCQDGPGASCPFEKWKEIVEAGAETYKDYDGVCKRDDED